MALKELIKQMFLFILSGSISTALFFSIDILMLKNGDIDKWGGLSEAFYIANFFGLLLVLSNSIGYLALNMLVKLKNRNGTFKYQTAILAGTACIVPFVLTGNLMWADWIFNSPDVLGLVLSWAVLSFFISGLVYLIREHSATIVRIINAASESK